MVGSVSKCDREREGGGREEKEREGGGSVS